MSIDAAVFFGFVLAVIGILLVAALFQSIYGELQCIDFKKEYIHIHATPVTLDGEYPPGNIGIEFNDGKVSCYKEMHTHHKDGWIHLESNNLNRTFTMGEFFEEWGLGTDNRAVLINNQSATFDTPLKDKDEVVIIGVKTQ